MWGVAVGQSRCSEAAHAGRTTLSTRAMRRSCVGCAPVSIASWTQIAGSRRLSPAVETDHSLSNRRIALQTIVVTWLESLTSSPRAVKD